MGLVVTLLVLDDLESGSVDGKPSFLRNHRFHEDRKEKNLTSKSRLRLPRQKSCVFDVPNEHGLRGVCVGSVLERKALSTPAAWLGQVTLRVSFRPLRRALDLGLHRGAARASRSLGR